MNFAPGAASTTNDLVVLEFWRAAFRRLTWRFAATAFLIGALLWLACSTNWTNDYSWFLEHWVREFLTVFILTAAIVIPLLAADEAVERGAARVATYIGAVLAGSALGAIVEFAAKRAMGIPTWGTGKRWEIAYTEPAFIFLQALMFGGLAVFAYVNLRSSIAAARARNEADLARVQAQRRTFESQLQAMQARVEPQFLFNTLAQVRALYGHDPARAGHMLDDLIDYLRAALPHLRESSSTIGKEVLLAQAYLNIMQVRLGEQLSFSFDVPEALRDARIPPMLLLPLIDHALALGRAPDNASARLSIVTTLTGNRLRVSVAAADGSGRGESDDTALVRSIAERVRALYGERGAFRIERNPAHGTIAILEIPYEIAHDDPR